MPENTKKYVGVDIAKPNFVADTLKQSRTYEQNAAGHVRFISELPPHAHVVCEASGGYEKQLVEALHKARIDVSVVMPGWVRHFARSQGILAKNDRIDARLITRYAEASRLRLNKPAGKVREHLQELLRARERVVEMLKLETNLGEHPASDTMLATQAAKRIAMYETQLKQIEKAMRRCVEKDQTLQNAAQRCEAVKGLGEVSTWTMLAEMPELGTLEKGQAAALLGVAPMVDESGQRKGARHIKGGRPRVRRVLYMAAISASQHNPILKAVYQRLRARGKPVKAALVAIMRKLIELLNRLLKYPDFHLA